MRKWNKLLALVLAMVMVFGLTATAFATEGDKAPAEGTEATDTAKDETAKDETGKTPAEGEDAAAPTEGEDDKAPAEGEDAAAPTEGEDDKAPAEGEDAAAPTEGEDDKAPAADPYADVADWAKDAVAAVVEKKLIDMGETGFNPTANMTRADLVVALYRLAGSPANAEDAVNPFTDVADDAAYKDAVIWAKDKGIVAGKSETSFDPTGDVKRQEIAKILFVYAGAKNVEEDNLAVFADVADIAAWAKDFVNWSVANKLISGKAAGEVTNMDPNGTATREQVALILNRYITEVLSADAAAPAEGDDAAAPAEGDDAAAPTEDGDKAPAGDDDAAAPTEDGDKAPAGDDDAAAPAEDGDKAPAGDDDAAAPADDADKPDAEKK